MSPWKNDEPIAIDFIVFFFFFVLYVLSNKAPFTCSGFDEDFDADPLVNYTLDVNILLFMC